MDVLKPGPTILDLRPQPKILEKVVSSLGSQFVLVDVGCATGISEAFRGFGQRLSVHGFEPNLHECRRLAAENTSPNIHFVPAFVGLKPDHPFARAKGSRPHWANNPWETNLAVRRSMAALEAANLTPDQRTEANLWGSTSLADRADTLYLDDYLAQHGIEGVDHLKIDVDGGDFEILHSVDALFARRAVLSVAIEVNFFGSDHETDHTFHNVDRYLRGYGFDLFGLTVRSYSAKSLPIPYLHAVPGASLSGRPLQGDALYVLDVFTTPASLSADQVLKLVAIFALFGLPDWAAEVLTLHGPDRVQTGRRDNLLELLCAQAQEDSDQQLSYRDYMEAFRNNRPYFFSGWSWERFRELLERRLSRNIGRRITVREEGHDPTAIPHQSKPLLSRILGGLVPPKERG